jgi:hypothetical protein
MKEKIVIVDVFEDVTVEDSGTHKICRVGGSSKDDRLYVDVLSESESDPPLHAVFDSLIGKRVRVTIEVLDDDMPGAAR